MIELNIFYYFFFQKAVPIRIVPTLDEMKNKYEVKPKKIKSESNTKLMFKNESENDFKLTSEGEDCVNILENVNQKSLPSVKKTKNVKVKSESSGINKRKKNKFDDGDQSDNDVENNGVTPPKKSKVNKVLFFKI